MPTPVSAVGRLFTLTVLAIAGLKVSAQTCESFGMDFQDGGSYFQNSLSTDPFTSVSQFEGCQNDTAHNLLVDPNGIQYQCTDTNLTPDDTNQMTTCPLDKDQLFSGEWSLLVISNNGDGDPIAYECDFSLSVGPQSTSTYTPTVTNTIVTTPVVNSTSTDVETSTTVLTPATVTKASTTIKPTTTVTPAAVTVIKTKTVATLKLTSYAVSIVKKTVTHTASCKLPTKASKHDPTARITPTIIKAAAMETPKHRYRRIADPANPLGDKKTYLIERRERLKVMQVDKRAPDPQPLIVTDTNTADWVTSTSTSTAPASTVTVVVTSITTTTSTPAAITVLSGKTTATLVTVTAPTPTKTKMKYTVATSWVTKTVVTTVPITVTTTPAASKSACVRAGGVLL